MRNRTRLLLLIFCLILLALVSCQAQETKSLPGPTETPTPIAEAKDLVFATILQPEQKEQLLDVYTPDGDGVWPVVVFLHGLEGTKDGYALVSQSIADQGLVVFTANWPTQLDDMAVKDNGKGFREMYEVIACSIRYARGKAADYQGDPSKVILVGHSNGASYGAWVTLGSDSLETLWEDFAAEHGGPPSQVECTEPSLSTHIDAFIGVAGLYSWNDRLQEREPDIWKIVSPYAFLDTPLDLPIRLIHGVQDDTAPYEASVQFNDALVAAGFNSKLVTHEKKHMVPIDLTISEILAILEELEE